MTELATVLRFFIPVRQRLIAAALLGALAYICSIGLIAVSGWLISRASQMPPVLTLSVAIVLIRAFGIGRAVFRYCERLVSHDAVLRSLVELRVALYSALAAMPASRVLQMRRADALTTLVRDVDEVQYVPLRALVPAVGATLAALVCVIVEFRITPVAGAWILAGWLIAATLLPWQAWHTARAATTSSSADAADLAAVCVDLIEGSADISALGLSGQAMAQASEVDSRIAATGVRFASRTSNANALLLLVQGITLVGAASAAINAIAGGHAQPVMLATAVFIPLAMTEVLAVYSTAALAIAGATASVVRLAEVLNQHVRENPDEFEAAVHQGDNGIAHPGIERTPASERHSTFAHTIHVAVGEQVGLTGASGAGKTTALCALAGWTTVRDASLENGPASPGEMSATGRLRAALAEQVPHIFATTIAENLQVARPLGSAPLTPAQMWAVLECVALDSWVKSLPQGLDSLVGTGGSRISGGQRQRLSLARMFVADPDVWLLDEPTAHLDGFTATQVLASVASATAGRTLVVASHDARDLKLCDRVIGLDEALPTS